MNKNILGSVETVSMSVFRLERMYNEVDEMLSGDILQKLLLNHFKLNKGWIRFVYN